MTNMRTGAEHIKSLKDGRTVYIDGELVADVTDTSGIPQRGACRPPRSTTSRRSRRTSS